MARPMEPRRLLARFGTDIRVVRAGDQRRVCACVQRRSRCCRGLRLSGVPQQRHDPDSRLARRAGRGGTGSTPTRQPWARGCCSRMVSVQHAGVVIGQDRWPHHLYAGFAGEHPAVVRSRDVTAATAACLLVRRDDFKQLGGFDTAFPQRLRGRRSMPAARSARSTGPVLRGAASSITWSRSPAGPTGVPQDTAVSARLYEQRWRSNVTPDDVEHYLDDGLLDVDVRLLLPR